jgi:hypothetical protein
MFRQIIGDIIRKFGFPLAGRRILFVDIEGPEALSLAARVGKITNVQPRSATSGEFIQISLQDAPTIGGIEFKELLLYPRHRWYGASALIFSPIAVCVATNEKADSVISVATIRLCRDLRS